jgi:hypothetical protein
MPNDDAACPVVSCEAGSEPCLAYESEIRSNCCKAIGECQGVADCRVSPMEPRNECNGLSSSFTLCDGVGNCVAPIVACGDADCTIGGDTCCYGRTGSTTAQSCQSGCEGTGETSDPGRTPVACDEHADCRLGFGCRLRVEATVSEVGCSAATLANVALPYVDNYELCESTVQTSPCSGGRACTVTFANLPGFKFCAHLVSD